MSPTAKSASIDGTTGNPRFSSRNQPLVVTRAPSRVTAEPSNSAPVRSAKAPTARHSPKLKVSRRHSARTLDTQRCPERWLGRSGASSAPGSGPCCQETRDSISHSRTPSGRSTTKGGGGGNRPAGMTWSTYASPPVSNGRAAMAAGGKGDARRGTCSGSAANAPAVTATANAPAPTRGSHLGNDDNRCRQLSRACMVWCANCAMERRALE